MVSIPFLNKGKKQSQGDVYIGIFFKEQEGVVMYLEDGKTGLKILATEHFNYSSGWEQLVDDIDEVLYRLESKTHLAPQKAIFFIYSHFVDPQHKEIKRSFLSKIKEAAKSLDLKPLGYIECQEAIVEHLRAKEHAPLHMVLLEFDKTVVTLALYQGGKNIYERSIARTSDVVNILTPILHELKQKYVLPNRLILYDEKALTNDVSALLSNRWDEEIFPTPPKIDILTQEDLHKSLVEVFARQIHAESAPAHESAAASVNDFVVADSPGNIKESPSEVMGFMIGDETGSQAEESSPHESVKKSNVKNPLKGLKVPKLKLPSMGKLAPLIGIAILVFLLLGLGGAEYVLHKAQIKVTFPATAVNKDITVSSNLKMDTGGDSRQVSETAQTTGQKQIGERAKGQVTIFNSNLQESQTLSKGTKLTGPNNLAFILDNDVKVASASGDASDISSSTAKVSASAADIGTEYNIGSGTKLTIQGESASTVIAKTESAFTGGSKKQVRVAAAADITKLRTKVTDDAKKAAAASLRSKIGDSKVIVEDLTEVELVNEKLSKKAGDETESITLSADVKTTYYTYDKEKLREAFIKELARDVPRGTKIQPESIAFRILKLEGGDDPDNRVVAFKVVAKAVPVVDKSRLTSSIAGKQVSDLDKIVKDGFSADGVEVTSTPRIPPFTVFTPFIKKNITVDVTYQ